MRSRNLKPSLFANEILGASDPYLTILFEGLWCLADREGRLEDRPLKIKGQIFPYRNFSESKMDAMLTLLAETGFIRRYTAEGKKIIQVVAFLDHQSPHSTEKESQLAPEPESNQQDTNNESITQTHPNSSEEGIRNQESGIRDQESGALSAKEEIFAYWQMVHGKGKAQFTVERKRKVSERLKDSSIEEIKKAIDGCRSSPHHQGQNERGTVYDDLELICRTRTHLEKFIGYTAKVEQNGSNKQNFNNARPSGGDLIANRPYR